MKIRCDEIRTHDPTFHSLSNQLVFNSAKSGLDQNRTARRRVARPWSRDLMTSPLRRKPELEPEASAKKTDIYSDSKWRPSHSVDKVSRVGCWGAGPMKLGPDFFRNLRKKPERSGSDFGPFDTKAPKGPRTGSRLTSRRARSLLRRPAPWRTCRHLGLAIARYCPCIIPIAYVQLTFIACIYCFNAFIFCSTQVCEKN